VFSVFTHHCTLKVLLGPYIASGFVGPLKP